MKYNTDISTILKKGGVGVISTDTVYGIVGSALNEHVVEKIYALRKRNPKKPMIVLIHSSRHLARFGITLREEEKEILGKIWPGKITILFPCNDRKFAYLHRGSGNIAFRVPALAELRNLLAQTGPLVAPSANSEGKMPSRNISDAKKYFGDRVDFYVDGGECISQPSTLVAIHNKKLNILREGAGIIPKNLLEPV